MVGHGYSLGDLDRLTLRQLFFYADALGCRLKEQVDAERAAARRAKGRRR